MITIISPAKTMNFDTKSSDNSTNPLFEKEVSEIISICKKLSREDLKKLMSISDKLADLNYNRFQNFFNLSSDEKQALFAYNGDVYENIDTENFSNEDCDFAQNHLRIISGLYGVIRPLDLIRPYRLEMGIKLNNVMGKDLYAFWKEKITNYFNDEINNHTSKILINLASNEYSNAIDRKNFKGKIIDIIFKENRGGVLKIIPINAKRARGLMTDFIVKNRIVLAEGLKGFDVKGYRFEESSSKEHEYLFVKNPN